MIGALIGGIGGGLAGLFGGGKQQQTQTNGTITNNTSSTSNGSYSNNPVFTGLQNALINQFTSGAASLYNQSTNMAPYTASGLQQINNTANASATAENANLAARGLSFSPAAATAQTQGRQAQAGQQSQFLNSIPLLQRQLQQQSLGQLMQAFQVIPTGSTGTTSQTGTQTGTQTQQGTNLVSGNPLAGATSGLVSGGLSGYGLGNLYNSFNPQIGGTSSQFQSDAANGLGDPSTYLGQNY